MCGEQVKPRCDLIAHISGCDRKKKSTQPSETTRGGWVHRNDRAPGLQENWPDVDPRISYFAPFSSSNREPHGLENRVAYHHHPPLLNERHYCYPGSNYVFFFLLIRMEHRSKKPKTGRSGPIPLFDLVFTDFQSQTQTALPKRQGKGCDRCARKTGIWEKQKTFLGQGYRKRRARHG